MNETFKSLPSKNINGGIQYIFKAPNGYGASIVQHQFSYGHEQGLWELAVTKYTSEKDWNICYDTHITSDVLGHLTDEEVESTLEAIKALQPEIERVETNELEYE